MTPRAREPIGARFARKRQTGADEFTRQWSLALSDNLEKVPKINVEKVKIIWGILRSMNC